MVRTFDAAGNMTGIERQEVLPDGGGIESFAWSMAYDARRRPTMITDPLGRSTQRIYDARNLETSTIDPLGRQIQRSFGFRGELLGVTSPVSAGVTATHAFEYDSVGRQIAYTDPEGSITNYEFDDRDRRRKSPIPTAAFTSSITEFVASPPAK